MPISSIILAISYFEIYDSSSLRASPILSIRLFSIPILSLTSLIIILGSIFLTLSSLLFATILLTPVSSGTLIFGMKFVVELVEIKSFEVLSVFYLTVKDQSSLTYYENSLKTRVSELNVIVVYGKDVLS